MLKQAGAWRNSFSYRATATIRIRADAALTKALPAIRLVSVLCFEPAEQDNRIMKIVVIGGSGLIGSQVVRALNEQGHEAVAASPSSGVNALTGDGLDEALRGADVVVDVSNSPSFEDAAVLNFFETSTGNLLSAEATAGVRHHVALSVVGADRADQSGYMRAKVAQERLIEDSQVPYTIVRATQFFEFVGAIADEATDGTTIRLSPAFIQPMAASDVAAAVVTAAEGEPVNGIVEVGGPEKFRFEEFIRGYLQSTADTREVTSDPNARYFGALLDDDTIVPGSGATLYETRFEDWLRSQ
jgi:uncharacterized protein YbjT (DUF2867 family)